MFALDCFLKTLFIFVVFYLVVTTYKKYYHSSTPSLPRIDQDGREDSRPIGKDGREDSRPIGKEVGLEKQPFEAANEEERQQEPIPTGEEVITTPDNIPVDPIEIVGDGTRMTYRGQKLEGQRQLIQLNSEQAIELKKKFDMKLIQDVIRFETGSDVFVVYRALSKDDFLDYFIFWNNQTPFRLPRPDISSDPSRESNLPTKTYKDIEFIENVTYPSGVVTKLIQERAVAFQNRNTTMGPTAIDSKRV